MTAVLIILELILIAFLVMFGSITLKKHFENKKSTKNTNTDSRKKLKRINVPKIVKTVLIGIMYVLAIVLQLFKFTPYVKTETYISAQNVPHTITVDRGYSSFEHADNYTATDYKGVTIRRRINYPIAALQFSLTTAIAVLAYYFWCCKKPVNIPITDDNTNSDILKKQNIQLQQTIDKLVDQNNKIELENRALKEQIMNIYNSFDEASAAEQDLFVQKQVTLDDMPIATEPPYLDINGLAFADDDEIRNAQKQYAEDLYKYFKAKAQRGEIQ